jgi:N-acyl amino acid synthase of PEP-CTERM/exosortase system
MTLPAHKTIILDDKNLTLDISRDPAHVARCQRLRYKVYCIERGWYNEVRISKGHEIDEYDGRSNHALLARRDNGDPIGVVRLVLPTGDPINPALPIQEIDPNPLTLADEPIDFKRLAEVSRFAVTRDYKNWASEEASVSVEPRDASGRKFSLFSVLLMRAIVLMSRENGIEYLCATMEPALILHLARLGLRFKPLGEPKEYHGLRQPCYARLSSLDSEMKALRPNVHPLVFSA